MVSLNAQLLTKHQRVDILSSASKTESVLTHIPQQPQEGPCSSEDLGLFAKPTKLSAQDVLTLIPQGTVLLQESLFFWVLQLNLSPLLMGWKHLPWQWGSSWVFPVGGAHGPTYKRRSQAACAWMGWGWGAASPFTPCCLGTKAHPLWPS